MFIPGNPGLPGYYTSFLTRLQNDLDPKTTEVYAIGHLGHSPAHSPRAWTGRGAATLREQVEHKVDFVDGLLDQHRIGLEENETKLVLIGHSIGSWVCCEVSSDDDLLDILAVRLQQRSRRRSSKQDRDWYNQPCSYSRPSRTCAKQPTANASHRCSDRSSCHLSHSAPLLCRSCLVAFSLKSSRHYLVSRDHRLRQK